MEVIKLRYPWNEKITNKKVVLALGFFDGVHRGHQQIINEAKKIAVENNQPLMVMTFNRHPREIYDRKHDFEYIDTLEEKAAKMEKMGVDYLVVLPFTEVFSKISGQEFVDNVIVRLNAATVVAGFDYTYGPKNISNMDHLPQFAKGRFDIVEVSKQSFSGKKIGSTEIRNAIKNGDMELADYLLGQPYVMSGIIGHGKRNGHKLGFPTANLVWHDKKVIPKIGVYATKTKIDNKWYESMTSVGYNVTINQEKKIYIESHLFGFNEEAYGKKMSIKWYHYTRGEIKFNNLEGLKKQLELDEQEIKTYFAHKKD